MANNRGPNYGGWNGGTRIAVNTFGVSLGAESAEAVVAHELAHNRDTESQVLGNWLKASGWQNTAPTATQANQFTPSGDGRWWLANTAMNTFARNCGQYNPTEDWTSTFEAYGQNKLGILDVSTAKRMAAKFAILDVFVTQVSAN